MSWRGVRGRRKNGCVIVDSKIEDMMGERRGETNKKKIREGHLMEVGQRTKDR